MGVKRNEIPDQQILFMFAQNDPMAWNALYESYAALIYGMVCQQTSDQQLREEIFEKVFLHLKNCLMTSEVFVSLNIMLCRVSNKFIKAYLLECGLISPKNYAESNSLLNSVMLHSHAFSDLAVQLRMSESDVKKRLRQEVNALRGESRMQ